MADVYPLTFQPLYKEKIWGGRSLERLFGRDLPRGQTIGESWELADLPEGQTRVAHGPAEGMTPSDLMEQWGEDLLGTGRPQAGEGFPLLLKLLDANDTLSLQVHPDSAAVKKFPGAKLKTECWYVVESRNGFIYKGLSRPTTPEEFRQAVEANRVEEVVRRIDVQAGDFHYLPAGTVHALGAGVVVAEVQTPSDTTFRVTDWGRGREIHLEESLACIHYQAAPDIVPGQAGETLLVTEFFQVARRQADAGSTVSLPDGRCTALMFLAAEGVVEIRHDGDVEPAVPVHAGDTVLVPAATIQPIVLADGPCRWLEITLPQHA